MLTKEQIDKIWNRTPEEEAEAERNRRAITEQERDELLHEFNQQNLKFYDSWGYHSVLEIGPDFCESYDFKLWFFSEEKNVSCGVLRDVKNFEAEELIQKAIEKYRQTLTPQEILEARADDMGMTVDEYKKYEEDEEYWDAYFDRFG